MNLRHIRIHPKIQVVLKMCIGVALLVALVKYIDLNTLRQSVERANTVYLGIGLSLVVANLAMQFLRWRYLLTLLSSTTSNEDALSSMLVGFSTGFFTPGQIGEHGGRIVMLRSLQPIQVLACSIIDKIYLLVVTILVGAVASWLYCSRYLPQYWTISLSAVVAALVVSSIVLVMFPEILKKILRSVLHKVKKYRAVSSFLFMKDVFHRKQARVLLFLTFAFYFVIILQYHFFVLAFEPVRLDTSALCTANILFIKSAFLPISFGDLGVRESTSIFFFSRAGVSAASAFNASLCIFFVNILLPSLAGSLVLLRSKGAKGKKQP